MGVIIGSGIGGMHTYEQQLRVLWERGPRKVSPFTIPSLISNMCCGLVAIELGARGPNYAVVSACASGAHAIGEAFNAIRRGETDVMIAGGSEAAITPFSYASFCSMKAMSTRNEQPEKACRPFDLNRDGFIMGEGAGILVLETLAHAQAAAPDLLRAGWLRRQLRCLSHHSARPGGAWTFAGDETRSCGGRRAPGGDRLHQCAWDLDTVQRQVRDAGDQTGLRRPCAQAHGEFDQVDDGASAGRRGGVEALICAKALQTGECRRRSTTSNQTPNAILTMCPTSNVRLRCAWC